MRGSKYFQPVQVEVKVNTALTGIETPRGSIGGKPAGNCNDKEFRQLAIMLRIGENISALSGLEGLGASEDIIGLENETVGF